MTPEEEKGQEKMDWWTLSGETLLGMLRQVAAGETPEAVYTREWLEADHERP